MLAIFLYVVKLDNDYQHNEKLRELVKTSAEWFKENYQLGGIQKWLQSTGERYSEKPW